MPGLEPGSQPKHLGIESVLPVAPQAHLSEPDRHTQSQTRLYKSGTTELNTATAQRRRHAANAYLATQKHAQWAKNTTDAGATSTAGAEGREATFAPLRRLAARPRCGGLSAAARRSGDRRTEIGQWEKHSGNGRRRRYQVLDNCLWTRSRAARKADTVCTAL